MLHAPGRLASFAFSAFLFTTAANAQCISLNSKAVGSLERQLVRAEQRLADAEIEFWERQYRWRTAGAEFDRYLDARNKVIHAGHSVRWLRYRLAVLCGTEDGPGRNHDADGGGRA